MDFRKIYPYVKNHWKFQLQPTFNFKDFFHSPHCYQGLKDKREIKKHMPYITREHNVVCGWKIGIKDKDYLGKSTLCQSDHADESWLKINPSLWQVTWAKLLQHNSSWTRCLHRVLRFHTTERSIQQNSICFAASSHCSTRLASTQMKKPFISTSKKLSNYFNFNVAFVELGVISMHKAFSGQDQKVTVGQLYNTFILALKSLWWKAQKKNCHIHVHIEDIGSYGIWQC